MTKIVELTDLVVNRMNINYDSQCIIVAYSMVDASGTVWGKMKDAFFWVTMPENPTENDFQLPSSYFPTLLGLQSDADAALIARFLV